MTGTRRLALLAGAAAVCAACGSSPSVRAAGPTVAPTTTSVPSTSAPTSGVTTTPAAATSTPPHFDTPEAAMRYLAIAWNANDLVALRHVTNPAARDQLDAMHSEAVNLRLDHCDARQGLGDYICYFSHDYPGGTPTTMAGGQGQAIFLVGPADTPGWYMTVFQSCG